MPVLSGFLRITTSRRVRVNPASPDLATDAMLAATALNLGANLVTVDRGFRRCASLPFLDHRGLIGLVSRNRLHSPEL